MNINYIFCLAQLASLAVPPHVLNPSYIPASDASLELAESISNAATQQRS